MRCKSHNQFHWALLILFIIFSLDSYAQAQLASVGPVSLQTGFPIWWEDQTGLRVELCLDPVCLPDPVQAGNPFSEQTGFGAEAFWWAAEALTANPAGVAILVLALEAAWLTEDARDGDQFPFVRFRVRADVNAPGLYTISHPFGTRYVQVDAVGPWVEINIPEDLGGTPTNEPPFSGALANNNGINAFFSIDAVPIPATPGGVFAGTGTIAAQGTANAVFSITGPGTNITTDQFSVFGKAFEKAAAPVPNTAPVANPDTARVTAGSTSGVVIDAVANDVDAFIAGVNERPINHKATGLGSTWPFVIGPAVFTSAQGGRVVKNTDGTFTYTPSPTFVGDDAFAYAVQDTGGLIATALVTVTVESHQVKGDINDDGKVGLEEAIYALQVVAGMITPVAARVAVQYYYPNSYFLGINLDNLNASRISSINVTGPNISTVWQSGPNHYVASLSAPPTVGDTYNIHVAFTDSTFTDKQYIVGGVNDHFAWIIFPWNGSTIATTTPTFTWQEAANVTSYHLALHIEGGDRIWYSAFNTGTSSVVYDSGEPLQSGQTYRLYLHTYDSNGNQATTQSNFTVDTSGGNTHVGLKAVSANSFITQAGQDTGFPVWYQDFNNLKLELCTLNNGLCLVAPPFDPVLGTGDEAFYWTADATVGFAGGDALFVMALEGAFLNGPVLAGEQISFGRIRTRINVNTPGTYTITHPFGTFTQTVDAADIGPAAEINVTDDKGCLLSAPCNFALALNSTIGPYLFWDTGLPVLDPAGAVGNNFYIGDAATPHRVLGSPNGNNFFRIERDGALIAQTGLFVVSGKIFTGDGNTPPAPEADTFETTIGSPVVMDVLANDAALDIPINPGSLTIITQPTHGTAVRTVINGKVQIIYTPLPGFSGVDAFTYTVANFAGNVSAATQGSILVQGT